MRQDITIADGTIVHTLDAFPFDSSPNLVTTVQGYRRGDRAVDAWTMQRTFAQFFSDGVFGTPADAFQVAKASSGLAVTIQPGMAVIQGAMGGIKESDGALTVTLDTAAAAGNVCYGIMLRYDNNSDVRSLGIRVVKGVAGSNPQPPAPDTTSAGVKELRLGYVTVPNGATDLSNATVTNEKGLSACPYAAPFEEIDMSAVTADAKASANEALTALLAYFDQYKGAIDAALDDSEATYLQQQISALQEQISTLDIDLSDEVDNETIEYSSDNYPTMPKKLRTKDGGVSTDKLADSAVTSEKLAASAFTDSASADQTASDKIAATPACVDAKLAARSNNRVVTTNKNNYLLAANQSVNFQWSGFQTTGFTAQSDGLLCNMAQVIIVSMDLRLSSAGVFSWVIYVNDDIVYKLPQISYSVGTESISVALYVEAGDKLKIKSQGGSPSTYIDDLIVQGV